MSQAHSHRLSVHRFHTQVRSDNSSAASQAPSLSTPPMPIPSPPSRHSTIHHQPSTRHSLSLRRQTSSSTVLPSTIFSVLVWPTQEEPSLSPMSLSPPSL